ncbi:MAG: hypothetical protein WAW37_17105 [Syntrophobacteraceae bacterium]
MNWKATNRQTRLYLVAAVILLVGMGSAIAIYLTAEPPSGSAMVYDFHNSKRYVHALELYGGKMNVLADRLWRWFEGLWHGRSLAFTVGWITIVISTGLLLVAYCLPPDLGPDARGETIGAESAEK